MTWTSTRPASRLSLVGVAVAALGLTAVAPAAAHTDRDRAERMRTEYSAGSTVPLLSSPNVRHVASRPGSTGISGCFTSTAPLFVMSNLDSIKVYDVSDPLDPRLTGTLPSAQFENEAMNCGERKTRRGTKRFALVGVDLYQSSADDIAHTNVGGGELVVVDVTDPADPHVRSRVAATTSTHTVACVRDTDCRFAYSAGSGGMFSIFNLTRLGRPREVDSDPRKSGIQPFASPTAGHKWNFDSARYGTHTGFDGSSMWDVSRPRHPELITTTGAAGRGEDPDFAGYNDFIHHNSFRPNAKAFRPNSRPSFRNGNILLVTEEDYEQTDCAKAGSFQTWHVKRLDGTEDAIVPLDKVELADLGTFPVPQYAFCSAHWFDYHPSGVVAVGFYGGGTQFVDVRRPRNLTSYGHASWGASEVWDAYWVPVYNKRGMATGRQTNLVYSVDLIRGLDVYAVDLPGAGPADDASLTRPLDARASANPFAAFSWPEDALPISVVLLALLGSGLLRRRSVKAR